MWAMMWPVRCRSLPSTMCQRMRSPIAPCSSPLDDRQLTELLRNAIAVYDSGAVMHGTQRMSQAGAQAKIGVAKTPDGQWAIPERGVPTTYIFKPQFTDTRMFPESDIVELFCQNVVAAAGLPAALLNTDAHAKNYAIMLSIEAVRQHSALIKSVHAPGS